MDLVSRFLTRTDFSSQEEFRQHLHIRVPEHFNFAYDVMDVYAAEQPDRLAMLFVERYERYARNGVLHVRGGQQSLSNATGLCLKTINRSIKKFAEQGLITKEGTKLSVCHDQYLALKQIVANVVDSE